MSPPGVRAAALTAALALALLSRGDVIVLAALLAVGAWRSLPALATVAALAATAWRWSSTALEHVAAAQAVLGPAGLVDPPAHAASAWLGALAIVLATPDLGPARAADARERQQHPSPRWVRPTHLHPSRQVERWLPRLGAAAASTVVVAGPGRDDLWIRAVALVVALVLVVALERLRVPPRARLLAAVACGVGSLAAVAVDAPSLDGVVDGGALVEGLVIALACALLAWAAGAAAHLAPIRPRTS